MHLVEVKFYHNILAKIDIKIKNTDLIIMYLLVSILNKLDEKVVKKEEVVEKPKKV